MPLIIFTTPPAFTVMPMTDYQLIIVEESGDYKKATNNRSELFAIYLAIVMTAEPIRILTDSQYCIHIFCGGFITGLDDSEILAKLNGDLILLIKHAILGHPGVCFKKIKAHVSKREIAKLTGITKQYALMNELADKYSKYDL
jgi:ribonuclease HI